MIIHCMVVACPATQVHLSIMCPLRHTSCIAIHCPYYVIQYIMLPHGSFFRGLSLLI